MTIIQARHVNEAVFVGSSRRTASLLLVLGPLLMLLASFVSGIVRSAAPSGDDAAAAAAPAWNSLAWMLDFFSVPAMVGWGVVTLLMLLPWSRRVAWVGVIALVIQVSALAAVTGMELLRDVLVLSGLDATAIQTAMDSDLPADPAGLVLVLAFFPTELVALICLGIAFLRTAWVPRWIGILFLVFPFADFLVNDTAWAGLLPFAALLAACIVLAQKVIRDGAPLPVAGEDTD